MTKKTRKFTGNIYPVEITESNQTTNGVLIDLIDWERILNKHLPAYAKNPELSIKLELFQLNYILPSLTKIPTANYPYIDEATDTRLDIQAKTHEFKRKYNVTSGHAIRIVFYEDAVGQEGFRITPAFAEEYLYNLGQWGYLNVLDPYLVKDSEVFLGDKDRKIALFVEGELGVGDRLVFRGAYSGEIEYEEGFPPVKESAVEREITTSPVSLLTNRTSRIGLYLQNVGSADIAFRFIQSGGAFSVRSAPILKPGQTLTIEHGKLVYPEKHPSILEGLLPHWINLTLMVATVRGSSRVLSQEFYF